MPSSWDRWAAVFEYAFTNAVDEDEAQQLYTQLAVPASGTPLFHAATANFNPWTQAKANYKNPDRGPMLIVSGERENAAPQAITNAIFKKQSKNPGVTESVTMPNRRHGLVIDHGWREVCDVSLSFIKRWVS